MISTGDCFVTMETCVYLWVFHFKVISKLMATETLDPLSFHSSDIAFRNAHNEINLPIVKQFIEHGDDPGMVDWNTSLAK